MNGITSNIISAIGEIKQEDLDTKQDKLSAGTRPYYFLNKFNL